MTPSEELLSAYLDDELGAQERTQVERRLASDPQWQETLEKLQEVRSWMQDLPAVTPSCPKPILQMLAEQKPDNQEQTVQFQYASSRSHTADSRKWTPALATAATLLLGTTLWWMSGAKREMALAPAFRGATQDSPSLQDKPVTGNAVPMSSKVTSGDDAFQNSQSLETTEQVAGTIAPASAIPQEPPAMSKEKGNMLPNIAASSAGNGADAAGEPNENLGSFAAGAGGFPSEGNRVARDSPRASVEPLSNNLPAAETTAAAVVMVEKFFTENRSSADASEYVVLKSLRDDGEQKRRASEEPSNHAESVVQLIVPVEAFIDLEDAMKSGQLGLRASSAISGPGVDRNDAVSEKDELEPNAQNTKNKRWLIELSLANYEALRTRWSEKGFDVTEVLDAPNIQIARKNTNDRAESLEEEGVKGQPQAVNANQPPGSQTIGTSAASTPPTNFIFILLQRR